MIWSDHSTNFVGKAKEIEELYALLRKDKTNGQIADFCSKQNLQWHYTPEHAPHLAAYGRLQLKVFKYPFRRIVGGVRLTFEELTTILMRIEACLNSRSLTPLPHPADGLEALTPRHFPVGAPPRSFAKYCVTRKFNIFVASLAFVPGPGATSTATLVH